MRRLPALIALLAAGFLSAQSFEVATVKLNRTGGPNGFFPSPGRLRIANTTLTQMIQAAHHVPAGRIAGATGWMQSDRYDIEAKAPGPSGFDEDMVMLRALLTDRFRLRFHSETRQLTTLAMVAATSGPKLRRSENTGQKERIIVRPGEISGTNIPFGHFITVLSGQLSLTITNETGIQGDFDLALKYVPDDWPDSSSGPSVYAALEEQLGLKLDRRKGPAEVFVIDSAEKPLEN